VSENVLEGPEHHTQVRMFVCVGGGRFLHLIMAHSYSLSQSTFLSHTHAHILENRGMNNMISCVRTGGVSH